MIKTNVRIQAQEDVMLIPRPLHFKRNSFSGTLGLCFSVLALLAIGCSSVPKGSSSNQRTQSEVKLDGKGFAKPNQNSTIEIDYLLGHGHYRLSFLADDRIIRGQTYIDKVVLERAVIDPNLYADYLQKILSFARKNPNQSSASSPTCRNPFKVLVQIAEKNYTRQGCRSEDDGTLSKLVKQGEFLLYSKI